MRISIIVAMAGNGVIGRGGKLPWHLGDDLKRFKQLTIGHTIVMGRKTWESIGRPLPGRRNVVISRQAGYRAAGADVVTNLETALKIAEAAGESEAFIIGGAEIYRLAKSCADRMYITLVEAIVEGDTFFPEAGAFEEDAPSADWNLIEQTRHSADASNEYPYRTQIYERREPRYGGRLRCY
jgi:dihydrofolate reductase